MKKNIILLSVVFVALLSFMPDIYAQSGPPKSPSDSAKISNAGVDIAVYYGRPSKRGREIFGKLVPFGEVWRTGANSATEIVVSKDVIIGGKALKSGRYTLFTVPQKDKWKVIFNTKLGQWGQYAYNSKDNILETEVPASTTKDVTETLTITLTKSDKGATLALAWDQVLVNIPIVVQ